MKWDRWQSTDKGRGKEKEQKEESSMMQTCDKKLQSKEKQQSPSAEGVWQQCRQCICASPCAGLGCTLRARRRFQGEGHGSLQGKRHSSPQASVCPGPRCSRNPFSSSELSGRSSRVGLQRSCLCALRGTTGTG